MWQETLAQRVARSQREFAAQLYSVAAVAVGLHALAWIAVCAALGVGQ